MKKNTSARKRTLLGWGALLLPLFAACSGEITAPEEFDAVERALHDEGVFELDGNAVEEAAPGDDWGTVLLGGGSALADTGLLVDPDQATIFWTGGSKDIHDVTEWRHKSGNVPPKDDLLHAFAAAYEYQGDLLLYFGADRYAVNGDAQLGFWFFQNEVGLNADSTFSGAHADGDVLVLSDFTKGGKVATISVYSWVSDGSGSDGNLDLVASGEVVGPAATGNVYCLPDDTACAAVNAVSTPSPWSFVSKFADPDVFPPGAFFEGGINLSAFFGEELCFSSFLAETRASQSLQAVLKDFVLGSLDTCREPPPPPPKEPCSISVTKACNVYSRNASNAPRLFTASFEATVTNTSDVPLPAGTLITVVDDAATAADPSDDETVTLTLAEPLEPGESVVLEGTFQTNENPPLGNVVTTTAQTGTTTLQAVSEPTECTSTIGVPRSISVQKCCNVYSRNASNAPRLFTASFAATVTNTSAVGLPAGTLITVVDDAATAEDSSDDETVTLTLSEILEPGESVQLEGTFQTNENPPLDNVVTATADSGNLPLQATSEPTECTSTIGVPQ